MRTPAYPRLVKKIFLDQQTVVVVAVVVLVETEAALVATSNLTAWTSFQLCKVDCKSELHQLKLGHCQVAQISNDNVPSVSLRTCVASGYSQRSFCRVGRFVGPEERGAVLPFDVHFSQYLVVIVQSKLFVVGRMECRRCQRPTVIHRSELSC